MTAFRQLITAVTVSGLLACSAGENNVERGNREGILYFGNGTEPQTIDPHVLTGSPEGNLASALFEPLIARNPYTLEIEPGVAERWEFNADRSVITFYLNPEARWSNGDPVTAQDFVWSWQRALNPKIGNQVADVVFYHIRNAEAYHLGRIDDPDAIGVQALDAHTLRVALEYSNPFALLKFTYVYLAPVHRATIEAHGAPTDRFSPWTRPVNFVGNGPFTLDEWKMQRFVKVKRNPYYWDRDNVALNGIVFRPIESSTTEEKMFRSGQLHTALNPPNSKIPDYRAQSETPLVEGPFMGIYYYMMNMEHPPLDNGRVRRAMALSIDRETLARSVLQDTVTAWSSYVPFGMPDYEHTHILDFDPEAARRLLAEAGYPGGAGFPALTLKYNTAENHRSVAIAVQQMWKQHLNIDVQIANEEWRVYLDSLDQHNYDIARMGWVADIYPGSFLDTMISTGGTNRTGFANAEYDRIILEDLRATPDKDAQMQLYQRAERIFLEETPLIPIYAYKTKRLVQPSLQGMPANAGDMLNYKYVVLDADAPAWKWQTPADNRQAAN
ncbi:peptide ABC transporter substrate-binding protein [Chromatocurvus halotolerans]|uniref:Oligopeptide transport system substrate-binding protein n=1 Tax=Chromatocurvus halotolerans TaxID=1132028 RepID=A0A4R2KTB0_9GAMM|nr:peptide ABC transporter substrate-binding protein [Chromatocurvus halotolerans]TCO77621.1 oligopeptide transport system substrate-binding protein [Chromatocurvus halotolerans]